MKTKTGLLATVALSLLGGCYLPQPLPQPDPYQLRDASDQYRACFFHSAHTLDDGRSDASTIALGIVAACQSEIWQLAVVYEQGMNEQTRLMYEQRIRAHPETEVESATGVVLLVRAQHER